MICVNHNDGAFPSMHGLTGRYKRRSEVNDEVGNVLVAQMLYLANEDPEADITLYINSPGGSVTAGLSIYDTMRFIKPDVSTMCIGQAASMGAFLLSGGTKGKRYILPNARTMIHQPSGGAQGQATDIEIQAKEILFLRERLNSLLADHTGQTMEVIERDTELDSFMSSEPVSYTHIRAHETGYNRGLRLIH